MFNVGPGELIIVALVLLIAVGPEQLPGVIRRAGTAIGQVKSMTDSLRSEFMSGLDEIERATDPNAWAASAGPSNVKAKPAKPAEAEDTVSDAEDTVSEAEDTVEETVTDAEDTVEDTTAEAQDTVSDTVEDTVAEATEAEDPIEETAADWPDASAADTNGSAPSNGSTPPEQAESETAEPVDPDPRESA